MPKKAEQIAQSKRPIDDSAKDSLRTEVKEALLNVLRSKDASAASKASAGRTLLEYFSEAESVGADRRRGVDLTAAELDDAIAKLEE
jgi:hypothetical protein